MGINYYVKIEDETLHIGKKSYGWKFLWHPIPKYELFSRIGWASFLVTNYDMDIIDEDGDIVSFGDFFGEITVPEASEKEHTEGCVYQDNEGNDFMFGKWS